MNKNVEFVPTLQSADLGKQSVSPPPARSLRLSLAEATGVFFVEMEHDLNKRHENRDDAYDDQVPPRSADNRCRRQDSADEDGDEKPHHRWAFLLLLILESPVTLRDDSPRFEPIQIAL